ncbi:TetR/AcrR family transcriptional regulator C-terminal domain-containing protein [Jiangella gansuensis]|uniref:TetR/AcrR family transcriptional regulator C-terminal domain-containing protein n=1 Tax=Jiangella gansuensis TaxID=281473 RepID=UPI0004BAD244|nr:TetR/AcrR family transcriptional regulator C-terminal domain-containing protein [Jiangella gansuensis]
MARTPFLTPLSIATAALQLGDREGAEAMTMRRIAAELGCDPMALYRHFADRMAMLDAVADLALADVPVPDPATAWDDRLRRVADDVRAAALRHPGIAAHVASRPPLGENGRRLAAAMLTALGDAGLPPAEAVRASQALVAYIAAGLAMAVRAGSRDDRWHQASTVLEALPSAPPGAELFTVGSEEQYRYGVRLLVAGIRAEAAALR